MTEKWFRGIIPAREKPPQIDTTVAHSARVYNFWLGGTDNFEADQVAAREAMAANPRIADDARANRAFLRRAVRRLAGTEGVRQFLDIGTGLPTAGNTHEVAQAVEPRARVVYVDSDPLVLAHARALLTSTPEGATAFLGADLREPDTILVSAASTLDFRHPIALMLAAMLHLIPADDDPYGLVRRLVAALPRGSYLVLSHPASDVESERSAELTRRLGSRSGLLQATMRDRAQVSRFFEGMDLLDPGVVQPQHWRPDPGEDSSRANVTAWCGVARKR